MSNRFTLFVACPLILVLGCGDSGKTDPKPKQGSKQHSDAHPPHGPNDGHVFELEAEGGQHLHVEIVEDGAAKKLTAVLLGEDMKKEVQSSAAEATIETASGGQNKSFQLKAEGKGGKASRYSSTEAALLEAVEAQGTKITFQVEVDGRRYKADVKHVVH
jgi:hypothetical protein